jgi:hypothetical protein
MNVLRTKRLNLYFQQFTIVAACLFAGCRTDSSSVSATIVDLSEISTDQNCKLDEGNVACAKFDQGKGSETALPIAEQALQFAWLGDLAQLYEYYELQLGQEFEPGHVFKNLSFETDQVLVVTDAQSPKSGRKVIITEIQRDGDGYKVFVEKWSPKKKGSGCKSFSQAISRPYHMVLIEKSLTFGEEGERPEVKLVPVQRYYKCPPGKVLE